MQIFVLLGDAPSSVRIMFVLTITYFLAYMFVDLIVVIMILTGDGRTTDTVRARAKSLRRFTSSASTSSPGSAPATNTTPRSVRAMPLPSLDSPAISSRSLSPAGFA